jgi:aspartyl-tRNA(Asn)/glutamyl-tRNA(Gln) amidotransferase subunit C
LISRAEVVRMAELAMLELNEVEIALYQADLNRFLQSGAELRKVNTQEVRLSSHVGRASSCMREDVIQRSLPQEKALRNGPCVVDGCFRVPRVMEDVR